MILYFSGSGNSRFAAEVIEEITGDELISMNDLIKGKKKEGRLYNEVEQLIKK